MRKVDRLEFHYEAERKAPVRGLAPAVVQRKHQCEARTQLHLANGIEIQAKSDIPEQRVLAGVRLVQGRFALQLADRDELLDSRQRQFRMRNRPPQHIAIFKGLRAAPAERRLRIPNFAPNACASLATLIEPRNRS